MSDSTRYPYNQTSNLLALPVNTVAFNTLSSFGFDSSGIRDVIIRMALLTNTPSSKAIWYALMAIAHLHRHGFQPQAIHFKVLAIKALALSVESGAVDAVTAAQHVAASMLLSSFEVCTPS